MDTKIHEVCSLEEASAAGKNTESNRTSAKTSTAHPSQTEAMGNTADRKKYF